ncbi:hypothetical protein AGRA3207_006050 [Actinomadura graeca]|uniref:Uncharacterized protein n=1 Tax=Actinomadura graeca TaxID=2750812 RepID=A0ABX8R0R8_9ACTN|nr:hypothetical protein [Actinomadura graeca]QXJ24676.1 hypothetical protein AGRA3207_006050 [Actinomadura graeca]
MLELRLRDRSFKNMTAGEFRRRHRRPPGGTVHRSLGDQMGHLVQQLTT